MRGLPAAIDCRLKESRDQAPTVRRRPIAQRDYRTFAKGNWLHEQGWNLRSSARGRDGGRLSRRCAPAGQDSNAQRTVGTVFRIHTPRP